MSRFFSRKPDFIQNEEENKEEGKRIKEEGKRIKEEGRKRGEEKLLFQVLPP